MRLVSCFFEFSHMFLAVQPYADLHLPSPGPSSSKKGTSGVKLRTYSSKSNPIGWAHSVPRRVVGGARGKVGASQDSSYISHLDPAFVRERRRAIAAGGRRQAAIRQSMVNAGERLDREKTEKIFREVKGITETGRSGYVSEQYNILLQHGNQSSKIKQNKQTDRQMRSGRRIVTIQRNQGRKKKERRKG